MCIRDSPTYDEWISQFDFTKPADMKKLESVHFDHLPVWSEGNVYLDGAKAWKDVYKRQLVHTARHTMGVSNARSQ